MSLLDFEGASSSAKLLNCQDYDGGGRPHPGWVGTAELQGPELLELDLFEAQPKVIRKHV